MRALGAASTPGLHCGEGQWVGGGGGGMVVRCVVYIYLAT